MADIPGQALQLAEDAIRAQIRDSGEIEPDALARAALEAAAPVLAETIAQKITAHKYAHEPKGPLIGGKTAEEQRRRTWRRHFSIAARVAAGAFCTDEDMKRLAAEAIVRGDFIACDIPEVPE